MSNKKLCIVLASPVLIPSAVVAAVMYGMLIGCGWLFVSMTFFTAAAAAIIGILGIVGAYMNLINGIYAALIMLGCGLCSLGFVYPAFAIAREFSKGFSALRLQLTAKAKELKEKAVRWLSQ